MIQGETGAQMLVAAHMVPHFESALTQVRKVPVETRVMDLTELRVRAPKVEQFRSVEASMRLDAVASAGFRTSRSKVADWIARGDVRCVVRCTAFAALLGHAPTCWAHAGSTGRRPPRAA